MLKRFRALRRIALLASWLALIFGILAILMAWGFKLNVRPLHCFIEDRRYSGAQLHVAVNGVAADLQHGLLVVRYQTTVEDARPLGGGIPQDDGWTMTMARNGLLSSLTFRIQGHFHRPIAVSSTTAPAQWQLESSAQNHDWAVLRRTHNTMQYRDTSSKALVCSTTCDFWVVPRRRLIPAWALLCLPALIHLLKLIAIAATSSKGKRRLTQGLCPECGYDLRASPDRCPECGSAVASPAPRAPYPALRINPRIVMAVLIVIVLLRLPSMIACLRCIVGVSKTYTLPQTWLWSEQLGNWLLIAAMAALALAIVRHLWGYLRHVRSAAPASAPSRQG